MSVRRTARAAERSSAFDLSRLQRVLQVGDAYRAAQHAPRRAPSALGVGVGVGVDAEELPDAEVPAAAVDAEERRMRRKPTTRACGTPF